METPLFLLLFQEENLDAASLSGGAVLIPPLLIVDYEFID